MRELILWGAGGHGKVVLDAARLTKRFSQISLIDDAARSADAAFGDCRIFATAEYLEHRLAGSFVVCIGSNATRRVCFERALAEGFEPEVIIHPRATVAESAATGCGSVVLANAVINAAARVGINCIINTGAVVEHDCVVGDHVHLSPGAMLGGGTTVHSFAHVGMGAVVLPGTVVGKGAVVGAGAVVLRSVADGSTVAGVPAKPLTAKRGSTGAFQSHR